MSKDSVTEVDTLQQDRRPIPRVMQTVARLLKRLAALIRFTQEDRDAAGIYRDHPGGE